MATGRQVYRALEQISGMSAMSLSVVNFILREDDSVPFESFCENLRITVAEKGCPPEEIEADYQNDSIREMLIQTRDELIHICGTAERHMDTLLGEPYITIWVRS